MSRLASLLRAGLRSNFGLSIALHRLFVEKKDRWYVPLFGLAALGILPTLYGYVLLIRSLYGFLQPLGQERALLAFGILFGQFLVLLFGFYYVVAAFYFSRDLDMLIPLPFRPVEVMLSKFAVILVNEYLTMMPLILPLLVVYGVLAKARFSYWAGAVAVYVLLPVIPLAIVSILVVGMMRLVNLSRKKDVMIVVGSIVLIVAAMGLQFMVGEIRGPGDGTGSRRGLLHLAGQPSRPRRRGLSPLRLGDQGPCRRRDGLRPDEPLGVRGRVVPVLLGHRDRRRQALLSRPDRDRRDLGPPEVPFANGDVPPRIVRTPARPGHFPRASGGS